MLDFVTVNTEAFGVHVFWAHTSNEGELVEKDFLNNDATRLHPTEKELDELALEDKLLLCYAVPVGM